LITKIGNIYFGYLKEYAMDFGMEILIRLLTLGFGLDFI
jgi:hypothetical protein